MSRIRRSGASLARNHSGRLLPIGISLVVFLVCLGAGFGLGARRAEGEEVDTPTGTLAASAEQTKGVLDTVGLHGSPEPAETDPKVAEELPHRNLDGEEALELAEGVFGTQLEEPAGIYDGLEAKKFLSDNAAVVPSSALAGMTGGEAPEDPAALPPEGSVLLESALPLRVENAEGEEEAVDLSLQAPEEPGQALEPVNPLVAVEVPAQLGEGVTLPGPGIGIAVVGAPQDEAPADVEESYAFYSNVARDTDLAVAPTPTGVDLMSDIRSADAPTATTYELSLPDGAELRTGSKGSVEVVQGEKTLAMILPPTATDAAGEPVAATQQVEGSKLTVEVSPTASTQYPILVDPEIINDTWGWTLWHQSMAAWSPSSNDPGLSTVPYAFWETQASPPNPSPAPGLDLTSGGWGNGYVGGQAQWVYSVPRYNEDYIHNYPAPTTWIYQLWTTNDWFLTHGNTGTYPAMVLGLADPGSAGWWSTDNVWYGYYGDLMGASIGSTNPSDHATKAADFDMATYENEYPAKYRDMYVGNATVALVDEDAPRILGLTAPTGWVGGSSASIGYSFEDTGLGVRSVGVRLPAEPSFRQGGANFNCAGTAESPCPRKASSSESGRPSLTFVPSEYPTGEDTLEVMVGDPFWTAGHVAAQNLPVKVDNTGPAVTLSGALTEQGTIGTEKSEYQLGIVAKDGFEGEPQSGVAGVEVKVDGKKITMSNETAWHPACKTQNCQFSGAWTMKASEYSLGEHEVEVIATDAAGNPTSETLEVEFGQGPPQTTFTSPHPSHETTELEAISFKATRGGAPVEGATFKCSLDGAAATACTSPDKLPEHFKSGSHTFTVAAVDKSGKADPTPATWRFETSPYPPAPALANEKLVFPETGKQTASYFTLEAAWGANPEGKAGEGVTGVTFQVNLSVWHTTPKHRGGKIPPTFETVPAECVIDGQGRQVTWPLPVHTHPGHSAPVYLKVRGCPLFEEAEYPEKEIQFRAVFDGSKAVAGASAPATAEFVSRVNGNRVATDATESVGPGALDLLTGAFTMTHTDVSIPVPGYEANLEFTRTYSSTFDPSLKGYSGVLGGVWQPGSPLESEGEGQAWSRIEKQVIEEQAAVYNDECWNEKEEEVACAAKRCNGNSRCEEWEEEPFQPREEWIELIDTEGAAVIFEVTGANHDVYVAPEYAKELKLTAQGKYMVLAYPSGSQTLFEESVANQWIPRSVSFQATPSSMRLVYIVGPGHEMKLEKEIAPNPDPTRCTAANSVNEEGCRTLEFHYHAFEIPGHYVVGGEAKLVGISYYGPSGNGAPIEVAKYEYQLKSTTEWPLFWGTTFSQEEMLVSEYDPRLPGQPEAYAYDETPGYGNLMSGMDSPGQEPWVFEYEHGNWVKGGIKPSRLKAVTRAGARTTIAYGVPTHGSGAPYAMGSEDIAKWGQTDLPVDATAIFPPNHVPSEYPPHEYTGATIHYMDPEGHEVNTASPSPPGVSGASISTTETDIKGNVVRELSPRNRLLALEAGAASASKAHELDTHSVYNANGTEMLESWGPLHMVRLEGSGEIPARLHKTVRYDEEAPAPEAGMPPAYLPTKETVAAVVPGKEGEFEPRTTLTRYEWKHRLPEETVVDPGGEGHLSIRTITKYNSLGQVEQTRQPKGANGGTAGDTEIVYYKPAIGEVDVSHPECFNTRMSYLPCIVRPVQQETETATRPQLPVKRYLKYNYLDEPEEVSEAPPQSSAEKTRTTVTTYDEAGRQRTTKTTGGGVEVPKTEIQYSPTLGLPVRQRFAGCEGECGPAAQFVSSIGEAGTGSGQFNHPADVAFDSKGDMWVVDRGNNRIEEFNEKGEFLRTAGSEGSTGGKLKAPSAITVDPSNDVWVADTANNRIEEFNEKGEFVGVVGKDVNKTKVEAKGTEAERNYCSAASGNVCQAGPEGTAPGQLKAPRGIAATSSGSIWVADTGHSRMEKYSPTGTLLNNSFSEGSEPGKLREPTAVAIAPNGSIWVADTGNNRIEYWLSTELGKPAGVFGSEGTGIGRFKRPDALEVAGGRIWVGDEGNSRVQEFDETGTSLGKFGSEGAGPGQFSFSSPIGLGVDPHGNFWITDPGHNKVQEWTPLDVFDEQATLTTYNALGQVTEYEDADGAKTKTTYDAYGRPSTVTDPRGTETLHYDEASGLVTSMEVSGVGTFTATYDADGNLVGRGLPNGLTATTTYNQADEPTGLNYTKISSCGASCTWYHESLERSIEGRILYDTSTLVTNQYRYDKDGRLVEAQETPTEGQCTSREYEYDKDSNRLSKVVRPGVSGACATSGGTPETYTYDNADRLEGPTYDAWGRITALPAKFAGGNVLKTTYFANDMVATQTQGIVTNTFQLDATGRQRQRVQAGGVAGIEVFHYDGPGDSPSWTSMGSTWSRNISGIGGELAAVQESNGTTTTSFKLTDLHGDAVASASSSPTETKLLAAARFTEFGEPVSGSSGRFGWLGGKSRRTELSSGVIQMGARSYVPSLGRFLTPDPVQGGSANPYDYANQDPVNGFDLDGNCSTKKKCAKGAKAGKKNAERKIQLIKTTMREAREARAAHNRSYRGNYGGIVIELPWEHQVNEIIGGIQSKLNDLLGHSCTEKAETFGFVSGAGYGGERFLLRQSTSAAAKKVAGFLGDIGDGAFLIGAGLYIAGKTGVC